MKPQPLVSIVIPCFNAAAFVAESIKSALGQTYSNIEVVAVDDGSTDETVDVLKSFGDRIRWTTGPNRGACAARNSGVELAKGDLIQFLDSDDLLDPRKLETQVPLAAASTERIPYCEFHEVPMSDPGQSKHVRLRGHQRDPVIFVIHHPRLVTATPIHHRSRLLAIGGFREHLTCCQEYDLHLRLAGEGMIFENCEQPLFTLRMRDDSISSNLKKVLRQRSDVFRDNYQLLKERGHLTEERARAFAGIMATDARNLVRQGLHAEAQANFESAAKMHSSGGIPDAYSWPTRMLRPVAGPILTERMVGMTRALRARWRTGGHGC